MMWWMDGMADGRYRFGPVEIVVVRPPGSACEGRPAVASSERYASLGIAPPRSPPPSFLRFQATGTRAMQEAQSHRGAELDHIRGAAWLQQRGLEGSEASGRPV